MSETPQDQNPAEPTNRPDNAYRAPQQTMPMSYAEPGRSGLIFSEKTDRAIGFLARVGAIYLIIGLVLVVIALLVMVLGGGMMYGMRGF
jgi:hypothetical protein